MKITIKTDNRGNIRKIRTNGELGLATAAIKTAADKPRRYRIKRTRKSRFLKRVKSILCRIGYVIAQTARAFKLALTSEFSREDVPRHQRG